jgi:hypothetical protein
MVMTAILNTVHHFREGLRPVLSTSPPEKILPFSNPTEDGGTSSLQSIMWFLASDDGQCPKFC